MAKKSQPPPPKPAGAQKKLCHLTYSQIAEWVGLAPRSVIQYASRGEFKSDDLESVLRWVNARRQVRGLPMIGVPTETPPESTDSPTVENQPKSDRIADEPDNSGAKPNVSHFPKCPPRPPYDPETGEFNE